MQISETPENPPAQWSGAPRVPWPLWACIELLVAVTLIAAGLRLQIVAFSFGSAPWLVLLAGLFLWWRKSGLGAIGLGRPSSLPRTMALGLLVGVGYQFFGTFVVEPTISV